MTSKTIPQQSQLVPLPKLVKRNFIQKIPKKSGRKPLSTKEIRIKTNNDDHVISF